MRAVAGAGGSDVWGVAGRGAGAEFAASRADYRHLLSWVGSFGVVDKAGLEGTGSYGAGLQRYLQAHAVTVIEVSRPNRHERPTRDYIARRLAEGKTKNEIMRCLKRYIAREIFHALHPPSRPTAEIVA